jgi:hypothetical protein
MIISPRKRGNHGCSRDFRHGKQTKMRWEKVELRFGFYQGADALGAQHFTHHSTIFHHADRLEVRAKSPLSGLLRPRTVETKGCFLTAMCTFSHSSRIPFKRSMHQSGAFIDTFENNFKSLRAI